MVCVRAGEADDESGRWDVPGLHQCDPEGLSDQGANEHGGGVGGGPAGHDWSAKRWRDGREAVAGQGPCGVCVLRQ